MIAVDVEASGTNEEVHSIVSVGAIDMSNPQNRFYGECRIWEGAHIMDEAMAVNGMTTEQITDKSKISEGELVKDFLDFIYKIEGDRTIVGQNPSFDRDFLAAAAKRAHLDWPLAFRTIDTHTLCYMHMIKRGITPPTENNRSALNLDAVMKYTGLNEEPTPHNALTGAMSHAEVASRLLYDKKLLPEFDEFPIPWMS